MIYTIEPDGSVTARNSWDGKTTIELGPDRRVEIVVDASPPAAADWTQLTEQLSAHAFACSSFDWPAEPVHWLE